jgi:hypothetical protein
MNRAFLISGMMFPGACGFSRQYSIVLNRQEYFEREGVNVMAYQDICPEGHP